MNRRVKQFQTDALINTPEHRDFVEKTESEILRGILTLVALIIIDGHAEEGIYLDRASKTLDQGEKQEVQDLF